MSAQLQEEAFSVEAAAAGTPPRSQSPVSFEDDSNNDNSETTTIHEVEKKLLDFVDKYEKRMSIADIESPKSKTDSNIISPASLPIHKPHAYPCADTHKRLPSPPTKWPQRPVMLRPTPNTTTRVRGIRYADSKDYQKFKGFCAGCILPINTGSEVSGKCLVIDFESQHFVGTSLIRIKDIPPNNEHSEQYNESYFDGRKRKFVGIVKGKFKTPLKVSECITGQIFDRPARELPAKFIVNSCIKLVSTLAPQLEATLEGDNPRFLAPLVATAQVVTQKKQKKNDSEMLGAIVNNSAISEEDVEKLRNISIYAGSVDIETPVEEPPATSETSMMQEANKANGTKVPNNSKSSTISRQKTRKKAFNKIHASHLDEPKFCLDTEYTFEFYQHLLLFDETFAVDMGMVIGKVPLAPITDGQPIKFMAAHKEPDTEKLNYLWSFDVWHESLYPYAKEAEETM